MGESGLFFVAAAVFGTIIGSFLNALLFRFNTGKSVLVLSMGADGRSQCMSCGHTLEAVDLVPLLSFICLRGRCRFCGSKISWQYPLVEATAAILSVLIFLNYPDPLAYAFWFVVWMTLLFIVVYDARHKIIPWSASLFLAVLALFSLFVQFAPFQFVVPSEWAFLAGPILAAPLFLLSLVSGGRWMGWGDSILELSLGWFLGLSAGASAFMLAFWSGALVGIGVILYQRLLGRSKASVTITMRSEMPFAPFLILGAAIAFFFHVNFFSTIYLLWR